MERKKDKNFPSKHVNSSEEDYSTMAEKGSDAILERMSKGDMKKLASVAFIGMSLTGLLISVHNAVETRQADIAASQAAFRGEDAQGVEQAKQDAKDRWTFLDTYQGTGLASRGGNTHSDEKSEVWKAASGDTVSQISAAATIGGLVAGSIAFKDYSRRNLAKARKNQNGDNR